MTRTTLCPRCGSTRTARLAYGLPGFSIGLRRAFRRGEVIYAGPVAPRGAPRHRCLDCTHAWRDDPLVRP